MFVNQTPKSALKVNKDGFIRLDVIQKCIHLIGQWDKWRDQLLFQLVNF